MDLLLEIVEGPGAGRQIALRGPVVLGRDESADVVLEDGQISRRHARVTPSASGGIVVEDLESTNGTLRQPRRGPLPGRAGPGRRAARRRDRDAAAQPRAGPRAGLGRARGAAGAGHARASPRLRRRRTPAQVARAGQGAGIPELDRLVDSRVKSKAMLAPLALFVLVALVVVIYLGLVN